MAEFFSGFFDDAAIFPPGLTPLDVAVREHIRRSREPAADRYIGPLILPVNRVRQALDLAQGEGIEFSVIAPADGLESVDELITEMASSAPSSRVVAVEAKLARDARPATEDVAAVGRFGRSHGIDVYLELPAEQVTTDVLDAMVEEKVSLKFRTGGVEARLFPSPETLIGVLAKAVEKGVAFKLTAGLHRAMRYTDPNTGFEHFGFLNVAAATGILAAGGTEEDAIRILQSDDAAQVREAVTTAGVAWRERFRSFGTCDVNEPAETLQVIGMLDANVVEKIRGGQGRGTN